MSNGKHSDDSGDEIDMPIRKNFKPQQFIEAQVQAGDTLQAIALRFNCSVSKLMRVNNILRENEIFAKRVLKIPVAAFSLLTETIPQVHTSGTNSPTKTEERTPNDVKGDIVRKDSELQQKLIIASVNASEYQGSRLSRSTIIDTLHSNDVPGPALDISSSSSQSFIQHESNRLDESFEEQIDSLAPLLNNSVSVSPTVEAVVINEFTSQGADWGIKWIHLLIVILILAIFVPFLYIFYIAEHPEKYHHHSS